MWKTRKKHEEQRRKGVRRWVTHRRRPPYGWLANHPNASYRNYTARVHLNAINNTPLIVPCHLASTFSSLMPCANTTRAMCAGPNWACSFSPVPASFSTVSVPFFFQETSPFLERDPFKFAGCRRMPSFQIIHPRIPAKHLAELTATQALRVFCFFVENRVNSYL